MLSFKWLVNGIIVPADLTPADCTPAEAEGRYVGVPPAALRMEGGIAAKAAAAAGHIGTATGGAALTLHINRRAGHNAHHVAEACYKSAARALRMAVEPDPRAGDAIPSTKGSL